NGALLGAGRPQCPPRCRKDCGITRRRKLFLGAEFERGAIVPGTRSFGRSQKRHIKLLAQTCRQSLTSSESATGDELHVASRTPPAARPAHAWTLLLPRSILARGQINPYLQGAQARGGTMTNRGAMSGCLMWTPGPKRA